MPIDTLAVPLRDIREALMLTLLEARVTTQSTLVSTDGAFDGVDTYTGGRYITVEDADVGKFRSSQLLVWYDGSGEETLPIAEGWDGNNPIPIKFDGMEYDQFQKPHQIGARLGTHLFRTTPPSGVFSRALDDPVVWVDSRNKVAAFVAMPKVKESTYTLVVEYRLTLSQQRAVGQLDALMHPMTWIERVRPKVEADIELLEDLFLDNDELTGPNGPTTLGYGNSGQVNPQIYAMQFGDVQGMVTPAGLQAGATALVTARGIWQDYEV